MKRSFDDVSVFEVIVVLGFFALMVMSCVAEASNYRPPRAPERGEIEVIQNQDVRNSQNQGQHQGQSQNQNAYASTDGNSQSINYQEEKIKGIIGLGIGGAHLYSNPHSDPECKYQVAPERNWFGMHAHGEVVETDEDCIRHKRILSTVQTFMALDRPDLALRYLCSEMALGCPEPNLYGGGDKADIDPDYVESLEEEVGQWRKQAVHGDLYK